MNLADHADNIFKRTTKNIYNYILKMLYTSSPFFTVTQTIIVACLYKIFFRPFTVHSNTILYYSLIKKQ